MVLPQSPLKARIWGYGEVGQTVSLIFDTQTYPATIERGMVTGQKENDSHGRVYTRVYSFEYLFFYIKQVSY